MFDHNSQAGGRGTESPSMSRRTVLKRGASTALAFGGLSTIAGNARADIPHPGDGSEPPYYYHKRTTYSPDTGGLDFLKLDHTTTVKWEEPEYDEDLGTDVIFFQVDTEAATYHDGDPSHLRGFIGGVDTTITYPENEVFAGTSHNWLGGMSNYTEPEDATATDYAEEIILYALGLVPYAGSVVGAATTAASLVEMASTNNSSDSLSREWKGFSGAERINTWSRYKAEVGDGEEYTIQIEDQVSTAIGGTNTFKIPLSNNK